jgi:3-oxoacyl-[acyl-carrier-protein] synthase II
MASQENIVITGVGVVSPIGIGKDPFWAALSEGRSGIRRLDLPPNVSPSSAIGGAVADFDSKQYVRPRKSLKVMSRDIQLAFAAADLACVEADLRGRPIDPERLGVVFGAALIPCELDELAGAYRGCTVDGTFDFHRWGHAAMAELFPLWMLKYLPNMPACHVGIAQDARGPNNTITLGDVSSLCALTEATHILERGQADAIIAGGVGSQIHPANWVRCHARGLSQRGENPSAASRPFDALRDGLVNGEGAAALFLETQRHALARGVPILARVLGCGAAFEPCRSEPFCKACKAPTAGRENCKAATIGRGNTAIRQAIVAALRDAGRTPADVGFVVAHGLSTIEDDRIEAQAIRATLGDVPVTAPKSYFGYLGAAAGSLEMVLSVLAFQHGQVPPTLNYQQPDPQCPINVIHGRPMPVDRPMALILSHSAHGQAVAVILAGA